METLIQYLAKIYPLSAQLQNYLKEALGVHEVRKRDFILKESHVCRRIYFIESGLFRCFYRKADHEVSSWFMKEGDVIIAVESFFNQIPSYESIQALEDSLLYSLEYSQLQYIYRHFPEFNYVGRVLTEQYYIQSEQRLYSLRMQRSQERYEYLLQHHPELILRVPAKYLASYLGITEVTMSKIRSRL